MLYDIVTVGSVVFDGGAVSCHCFTNPMISPLTVKYECPQLSLLINTSDLETSGRSSSTASEAEPYVRMYRYLCVYIHIYIYIYTYMYVCVYT